MNLCRIDILCKISVRDVDFFPFVVTLFSEYDVFVDGNTAKQDVDRIGGGGG
jgi:hypothetical protein